MLFVDTANFEEAKRWVQQYGICKGITTNQAIWAKECNVNYDERIKELLTFKVPTSIELTKQNCSVAELVSEAEKLVEVFGREYLVIKVPMWKNNIGLDVAKQLLDREIKVNMTVLMNLNQAVLAIEQEVDYVSFFYNRMLDFCNSTFSGTSPNVRELVGSIIENCRKYIVAASHITQIICGSIRDPNDVAECFIHGAHIVTVTPKVLEKMHCHPKTDETIKEFDAAWSQWSCKK